MFIMLFSTHKLSMSNIEDPATGLAKNLKTNFDQDKPTEEIMQQSFMKLMSKIMTLKV